MGKQVEVDFFTSFINLTIRLKEKGHNFNLYNVHGVAHASARNTLIGEALADIHTNNDITHILWLDSDHVFTPEQVMNLIGILDEKKLDCLSAGYFIRSDASSLCAMSVDLNEGGDMIRPGGYKPLADFSTDMLYEVGAVGFGMFVMRPEVALAVEKLQPDCPFQFTRRGKRLIGEDVGYCELIREAGYKIFVHTGIIIGHIDAKNVDLEYVKMLMKYKAEEGVEGWLQVAEGNVLFQMAGRIKENGTIVEIGSYKGKSSIRIALGMKATETNGTLYCIDPFTGLVESIETKELSITGQDTFDDFMRNIKKHKVDDVIVPIKKLSEDAAKDFDKPIDMIFIDGDHDYEAVKKDFMLWYPKVKIGGTIAFHDSNWPGVKRLLEEEFLNNDRFTMVKNVASLTYGIKVK